MTAVSNESEKDLLWEIQFKVWTKNGWKSSSIKVTEDYFKGITTIQQLVLL